MAIDLGYLEVLNAVIIDIKLSNVAKGKVGCLSYPDLIVRRNLLSRFFKEDILQSWSVSKFQGEIKKWHGLPADHGEVFETENLFKAYDFDVEFLDVKAFRGVERILDLNEPLTLDLKGRYDLVVDTGTLEHCFNVGNAFRCMCEMVRKDGFLISAAPLSKMNHGFWNFSPTAYVDGLSQNGFEVISLDALVSTKEGVKKAKLPSVKRFMIASEAIAIVVARRRSIQNFRWPTQSKYLT